MSKRKFTTTVLTDYNYEDDYTYQTKTRTYWEIDADGKLDIFTGDHLRLATHLPGTFDAVSCERSKDV